LQDANLKLDEVSLVTILAASGRLGCLLNGKEIQALKLLREAQVEGMEVDAMMIGSTLLACSGLKCLSHAKEVHGYALKQCLSGLMLQNMIVDVYGSVGILIMRLECLGRKNVKI
jgi:hypothetical protein